jgi:hypothetical protein
MRVTKFMVDRAQPRGSMKVGNQWRPGFDRNANTFLPERRVDDYSWKWDTEPKSDLPRPPMGFDVVAIRDTDDHLYRLAFEVSIPQSYTMGTFSIADQSEAGLAMMTTQPVPRTTPGLITIDFSTITRADLTGTFFIMYQPTDPNADIRRLFFVTMKPDRDWMYAPMVRGPWERSKGRWVDAQ